MNSDSPPDLQQKKKQTINSENSDLADEKYT